MTSNNLPLCPDLKPKSTYFATHNIEPHDINVMYCLTNNLIIQIPVTASPSWTVLMYMTNSLFVR